MRPGRGPAALRAPQVIGALVGHAFLARFCATHEAFRPVALDAVHALATRVRPEAQSGA